MPTLPQFLLSVELSELDPGELYVHSITRKSRNKLCTGPIFHGKRSQQIASLVSSRAAYFPCNPPPPHPYNKATWNLISTYIPCILILSKFFYLPTDAHVNFTTIHLCISWWIKKTLMIILHAQPPLRLNQFALKRNAFTFSILILQWLTAAPRTGGFIFYVLRKYMCKRVIWAYVANYDYYVANRITHTTKTNLRRTPCLFYTTNVPYVSFLQRKKAVYF